MTVPSSCQTPARGGAGPGVARRPVRAVWLACALSLSALAGCDASGPVAVAGFPGAGAVPRAASEWSENDRRAVLEAAEADVRRFSEAFPATHDPPDRTGLLRAPDDASWSDVAAFHEAALAGQGFRRDTTFAPFPAGSASRSGAWRLRSWRGEQATVAVALVDVLRPSTGRRVRYLTYQWAGPDVTLDAATPLDP